MSETFVADLKSTVQKHFPNGFLSIQVQGNNTIFMATATLPKGEQKNGIIHNDPCHQHFWMHDCFDVEGDLKPRFKVEMSMGGRFYGQNASHSQKVGWRDKTGTPSQIITHFDKYFAKLRAMADQAR